MCEGYRYFFENVDDDGNLIDRGIAFIPKNLYAPRAVYSYIKRPVHVSYTQLHKDIRTMYPMTTMVTAYRDSNWNFSSDGHKHGPYLYPIHFVLELDRADRRLNGTPMIRWNIHYSGKHKAFSEAVRFLPDGEPEIDSSDEQISANIKKLSGVLCCTGDPLLLKLVYSKVNIMMSARGDMECDFVFRRDNDRDDEPDDKENDKESDKEKSKNIFNFLIDSETQSA